MKKKQKTDNRPFSERHPKLNFFIGLIILIAALILGIIIIYFLLKYIGKGISLFVDWLKDLASKLEAVVIVALITGSVSLTGVIISSIISKRIDYKKSRKTYLAQKREQSYYAFIEMVYKIQKNGKNPGSYTEKEMIEDIYSFSQELTLWGSKRVVDKWVQFRANSTNPSEAYNNLLLLEDIMNEMRNDMGVKKVKKGNLLSFFVNDIKTVMKAKK